MRIQFRHFMGTILVLAGLAPFAMTSVMAVGWEKTLGCLLVGLALALSSIPIAMGSALFSRE